MPEYKFNGIGFTIDTSRFEPAYFALSVRKSGSSMFNIIMARLAHYNRRNFVDVPGKMFSHDVAVAQWIENPELNSLVRHGNLYGGFRNFPKAIANNRIFVNGRKVLLMRDPRDALVSEYFSNAFSHQIPDARGDDRSASVNLLKQRKIARTTKIDDYVRKRAPLMAKAMAEYLPILDHPSTLYLRYEDIIFEKRRMLREIVDHFRWRCSEREAEIILNQVDLFPTEENPAEFVRKVKPGDHLEKLSSETIDFIDDIMTDVLPRLGYPRRRPS